MNGSTRLIGLLQAPAFGGPTSRYVAAELAATVAALDAVRAMDLGGSAGRAELWQFIRELRRLRRVAVELLEKAAEGGKGKRQ